MTRARGSIAPPSAPDPEEAVLGFAAVARRFCAALGAAPPVAPRARAQRIAELGAELYAAAAPLLAVTIPEEQAVHRAPDDTVDAPAGAPWADFGLGSSYRVLLEPFGDDEPTAASLQDDLEEILAELSAGLAVLAENPERWAAAGLEWKLAFVGGWGRNLAALLYAAHCALDT
jgi:hypothetical protein